MQLMLDEFGCPARAHHHHVIHQALLGLYVAWEMLSGAVHYSDPVLGVVATRTVSTPNALFPMLLHASPACC